MSAGRRPNARSRRHQWSTAGVAAYRAGAERHAANRLRRHYGIDPGPNLVAGLRAIVDAFRQAVDGLPAYFARVAAGFTAMGDTFREAAVAYRERHCLPPSTRLTLEVGPPLLEPDDPRRLVLAEDPPAYPPPVDNIGENFPSSSDATRR